MSGRALGLGWALAAACGCGAPPALPPVEPPPTLADGGDGVAGARRFADRTSSRTGFACADCHPGPDGRARPAPALGRWAGGQGRWAGVDRPPAESLAACVERFQARGPLSPTHAADLSAAIAGFAAPTSDGVDTPDGLYRAACAHCHEDGPAGALVGRPLTSAAIRDAVRGPGTTDRRMPAFARAVIDDAALDGLVRWLSASAVGSGRLSP